MTTGWICPRCGKANAPWVATCRCADSTKSPWPVAPVRPPSDCVLYNCPGEDYGSRWWAGYRGFTYNPGIDEEWLT